MFEIFMKEIMSKLGKVPNNEDELSPIHKNMVSMAKSSMSKCLHRKQH